MLKKAPNLAQRTGNWKLYRSTKTLDGFAPLFFTWGRYNYNHSITEQLLQVALDSPYEETVKNNDCHFPRYKDSNVLMAGGSKLSYITKGTQILTPGKINKQNLHQLLEMSDRYKHHLHMLIVDNIRCFIEFYNILSFTDEHNTAPTHIHHATAAT